MPNHFRIAAIPGDGIGPEVLSAGMDALNTASESTGDCTLQFEVFDWGTDYYLNNGRMMPPDALEILKQFDAIYLGAIGDPRVPDHISLQSLLEIRKGFDQYINLRPVRLLPGVEPMTKVKPGSVVDLVVIRENTEGEYCTSGGRFRQGTPDEVVVQNAIFTRKGTERTMRYAFDLAMKRSHTAEKRNGGPRPMVTDCTKSNALVYSMVFWDEVYDQVAQEYPEVHRDKALVDALTLWLVQRPEYYDVIVASNLFGDIITDLCAAIQGGLGMAASGNINPERTWPSMFEPVHGSAPNLRPGQANPIATIWAGSLMLSHLGEEATAQLILSAIEDTLSQDGPKTADLGGNASTSEVLGAVKSNIVRLAHCTKETEAN